MLIELNQIIVASLWQGVGQAHCLTEESYFERRGCLMGNLTL